MTILLLILPCFLFSQDKTPEEKPRSLQASWPSGAWQTSTPELQGMDSKQLGQLIDFVRSNDGVVHSVTIIRNGYVVLDGYFYPFKRGMLHDMASVTKSITSTLIGIAIDKGYIQSVDEPVLKFFPDMHISDRERKRSLTIRHLLTMTSGFCPDFPSGERQLEQMRLSPNAVEYMLNAPLVDEPGRTFAYCSGASQLLSAIITQSTGMNAEAFARKYLFEPLGIHEAIWPADPQGNSNGWGDVFLQPLDMAKMGYLFLREGEWKGEQVISKEWIREASREQVRVADDLGYGYRWWLPYEIAGFYEARGRGGQRIVVWPESNLVLVFTGSGFEPGDLGRVLIPAIRSSYALPEDPEAYKSLVQTVKEASQPPVPDRVSALPKIAKQISGKIFRFSPNALGVHTFSLSFSGEHEASITIVGYDPLNREEIFRFQQIGLDGRYRISNTSRFQLPSAARGSWVSETEFELVYDELGNNHVFSFRIRFGNNNASLRIVENTGLINATLNADLQE